MKRAFVSFLLAAVLAVATLGVAAATSTSSAPANPEPAATAAKKVLVGTYPWGIAMGVDRAGKRHVVASRKNGDLWYATDRTGTWASKRILKGSDEAFGWVWGLPSIAIDGNGRIHIAVVKDYAYDTPGGTDGIWYLTDKGRSRGDFGARVKIAGDRATDPSLRVAGGVRYLAYAILSLPGKTTWPVYFKTDRGGSWKRERVASRGYDPALRVDRNGRAHIAFGSAKGVRYARARTKTGDFTKPRIISGNKQPSDAPSLVMSPANRPHVVWPSSKGGNRIWYAKRKDTGWKAPLKLGNGSRTEISMDAKRRPHVVLGSRQVVHKWRTASGWKRSVVAPPDSSGFQQADVAIRAYGTRASIAWAPGGTAGGVWVARD